MPVQPPVPLQPVNTEVASGVAVSVTVEPVANSVQVAPQLMPAGSLVTAPPPAPASVSVRFLDLLEVTRHGLGGVHRDDARRR